jgi:tetratricopeptide (TPR) repeat protein
MATHAKYKVVSIRQPQAWAVCVGEKTVENKSKGTRYRGPVLVHAGKNREGLQYLEDLQHWPLYRAYFELGAIIGIVELYDAVDFNRSLEVNLHACGPCCYLFRNAKWFDEGIMCTGQLGIFNLPEHLVSAVERQLKKPGRRVEIGGDLLQAIRPHPSDACCDQGRYYLENDQIDDALRRFDGAIKLDPENPDAFYLRSLAHDREDRMDEAIRDISAAIELDAENPDYFYQRGYYQWSSDRLQESIKDYSTAIELDATSDMPYVMRGISYHLATDDVSALADLSRAQALNQGNMLSRLVKGGILLKSGKHDEGITELRAAEERFSDHSGPSYLVYWGYTKAGQAQFAREALSRFQKAGGDEEEMKAHMQDWGFIP